MIGTEAPMRIEKFSFGHITIDGVTYDHDVSSTTARSGNKSRSRRRHCAKPSPIRRCRRQKIPWKCRRLVIGTGAHGNLPVTDDVKREAARRELELVILPTVEPSRHCRRLRGARTPSCT